MQRSFSPYIFLLQLSHLEKNSTSLAYLLESQKRKIDTLQRNLTDLYGAKSTIQNQVSDQRLSISALERKIRNVEALTVDIVRGILI